mgnify:CR=1 FL=1
MTALKKVEWGGRGGKKYKYRIEIWGFKFRENVQLNGKRLFNEHTHTHTNTHIYILYMYICIWG